MLAERIRSGLLAFDTGQGLVYAQPTNWQRIYLLWTFRNFRSLPKRVLNPRQQKLIDNLYSSGSCNMPDAVGETVLIGTVEDVHLPSPAPVLVAHPAKRTDVSEGNSTPRHTKRPYARVTFSKLRLVLGTGALCAMIAALALYKLGAQPISAAVTVPKVAAVQQSGDAGSEAKQATVEPLPSSDTQRSDAPPVPTTQIDTDKAEKATSPPPQVAAVEPSLSREADIPRVVNQREPDVKNVRDRHVAAELPELESRREEQRIHTSAPPRRLVYPTYPETSARGKVALKAVIGYDGAVNEVKVLTGNRMLAAAAIRAVRQWRYQPYSRAGQPLEAETNITISFIASDVIAISFPAPTLASQ